MRVYNPNISKLQPWPHDRSVPVSGFDFDISVAHGQYSGIDPVSIIGNNLDIDIGTETIWTYGGTWTPLTSADGLTIVSSSASDSSLGTGAQSIVIYGVDENRNAQFEVVTLKGIVSVFSNKKWLGINYARVYQAGSGLTNAGTITLTATIATTVQCQIPTGESLSKQAIYHHPNGSNFYLQHLYVATDKISGSSNQPNVQIKGYYVDPLNVQTLFYFDILNPEFRASSDINLSNPVIIPAGSYLWFNSTTDQNNTFVRILLEGKSVTLP